MEIRRIKGSRVKSSRPNNEVNIATSKKNLAEWPWIDKLFLICQTADQSKLRIIDGFIKGMLELDEDTRDAFFKVFCNKKYGSFTFVFRAGKCIGFDWKSSHRKPKQK